MAPWIATTVGRVARFDTSPIVVHYFFGGRIVLCDDMLLCEPFCLSEFTI